MEGESLDCFIGGTILSFFAAYLHIEQTTSKGGECGEVSNTSHGVLGIKYIASKLLD